MAKQSVAELNRIMAREEAVLRAAFNKAVRKARSSAIRSRDPEAVTRHVGGYVQDFTDELSKSFIRVAQEEIKRIRSLLPRHVLKQVSQRRFAKASKFPSWYRFIETGEGLEVTHADKVGKHNPYHDARGRFTSASGVGLGAVKEYHKAIDFYTDGGNELNLNLRNSVPLSREEEWARDALDKLIAERKTIGSIVVYRGVIGNFANELKLGAIIKDRGFISTSSSKQKASSFMSGIIIGESKSSALIRFVVPQGMPILSIAHSQGRPGEREFILPRGLTYKVTGIEEGAWLGMAHKIFRVEFIPEIAKASASDFTELGIDLSFDPADEEAALLIDKASFDFMQDFSDKQIRAVRAALAQSLRDGDSVDEMARAIRDSIGLTETQLNAVNNYRSLLENSSSESLARQLRDRRFDNTVQNAIDQNDLLDADQIDRMVERYADRMLDYRARMIARTESHRVTSAARNSAWRQMVDQLGVDEDAIIRTWNAVRDRRTRDTHQELDGQQVQGFEPFESSSGALLMYPGDPAAPAEETIACRCVESYDFNMDMADEEAA